MLKDRCLKLPKAKYLLGQCCLELSKWQEAESTLTQIDHSISAAATSSSTSSSEQTAPQKTKLYEDIMREYDIVMGPRVLHMLGQVYSKTERHNQAVDYFKRSLRANPFGWESFEALCDLGEFVEAAKYFTANSAQSAYAKLFPVDQTLLQNQVRLIIFYQSHNYKVFFDENNGENDQKTKHIYIKKYCISSSEKF